MTGRPIALITSAAYVNDELAAEFGRLPASFLPFGHNRLFQDQVTRLSELGIENQQIVLTVPESFRIPEWDRHWLERHDVMVVPLRDGLSLCESVLQALIASDARGPLRILHGDTLFLKPLSDRLDAVGVAPTGGAYPWGRLGSAAAGGEDQVLTGWFALSSAPAFLRCLARAEGSFTAAIDAYDALHPLAQQEMQDWLDFGHLQTFYRARAQVSTARSFNSVHINEHTVVKTGDKADKLEAEAAWFDATPAAIRLHTPPFLGRQPGGYSLGYEVSPTLHEIYVFGQLGPATWRQILAGCFGFLETCADLADPTAAEDDAMSQLALGKTPGRLADWSDATGVDLNRVWSYAGQPLCSLNDLAQATAAIAQRSSPIHGVMHGDLCFPNMFFNFRQGLVKVIDPRGSVREGRHTPFGDLRYDLAKLNHSLEGYDLILAGRYQLTEGDHDLSIAFPESAGTTFLPTIADEFSLQGQGLHDPAIVALTVHLFLSMLPLHADRPDRQRAFLANALRLGTSLELKP